MWKYVLVVLFIFQALVDAAIIGNTIRNARAYKVPFGRQYLPEKLQIIVLIWLMASLFANVMFVAVM